MERFIVISLLLIFCAGCFTDKDTRMRGLIKEEYDIELTQDDCILYETECYGFGDGSRYIVLQFAEEPKEVLNKKYFYTNKFAVGTAEEKSKILEKMKRGFNFALPYKERDTLEESYKPDWEGEILLAGVGVNLESNSNFGDSYYYNIVTHVMIIASSWM